MVGPEDLQQLLETDDLRVVVDLNALAVVAEAVVGRIRLGAAGIADAGADNSGQAPKLGVRAPESAHREGGGTELGRSGPIQWWNLDLRPRLGGHSVTSLSEAARGEDEPERQEAQQQERLGKRQTE